MVKVSVSRAAGIIGLISTVFLTALVILLRESPRRGPVDPWA